jgi:predicted transcriptional regulator
MKTLKQEKKDNVWTLRKILTRPNYAIIDFLLAKSPRATKEIYSALAKKFTRKTLIIALKELSIDMNVIQPTHIRTEKGYGFGYNLNPKAKVIVKTLQKFAKTFEGFIDEKK